MNLLPLWGQEAAMLRLAKQVTALLSCLGDLFTEYSSPAPLAQDDRVGLYGDGIPIALHDMQRYACLHSTMRANQILNLCVLSQLFGAFSLLSCCWQV